MEQEVLAGQVAVRPVAAVPRSGCVDDPWVRLLDPCVSQAKPFQYARTVVLDHDVGPRGQLAGGLGPTLALEIQGDAAEISIGEHEEGADPVQVGLRPRPVPFPSPSARRFDLDHLGAHVGQVLAGRRTEEELREREDAHAGQKPEASLLGQSTSCMMCVATATSSSFWFLTSTFARVRCFSRSTPVIS